MSWYSHTYVKAKTNLHVSLAKGVWFTKSLHTKWGGATWFHSSWDDLFLILILKCRRPLESTLHHLQRRIGQPHDLLPVCHVVYILVDHRLKRKCSLAGFWEFIDMPDIQAWKPNYNSSNELNDDRLVAKWTCSITRSTRRRRTCSTRTTTRSTAFHEHHEKKDHKEAVGSSTDHPIVVHSTSWRLAFLVLSHKY